MILIFDDLTVLTAFFFTTLKIFDNFYNWKDNPGDLWHLRHWLQFWQLRPKIHDNLCYLIIKSDTGQHSQFLQCLVSCLNLTAEICTEPENIWSKNKSSVSYEMMPAPITFIIKAANNIFKMTLVFQISFSHCFPIQIFAAMFVFYCHLT